VTLVDRRSRIHGVSLGTGFLVPRVAHGAG